MLRGSAAEEHGPHVGGAKRFLISILWERLLAVDGPRWAHRRSSNSAAPPIQVVRDPLGKPHLLLGESRGPAISFSESGGTVWAALCGDDGDIGIDVAEAGQFQGGYPVRRVFGAVELEHAVAVAEGNVQKASALLWSVKEAAAKALGCAFHLVEPRDLQVLPTVAGADEYTFAVRLSRRALGRLPMAAGRPIRVRALPQAEMWLAIAFLNPWSHSDGGRPGRRQSAPQKRNVEP